MPRTKQGPKRRTLQAQKVARNESSPDQYLCVVGLPGKGLQSDMETNELATESTAKNKRKVPGCYYSVAVHYKHSVDLPDVWVLFFFPTVRQPTPPTPTPCLPASLQVCAFPWVFSYVQPAT